MPDLGLRPSGVALDRVAAGMAGVGERSPLAADPTPVSRIPRMFDRSLVTSGFDTETLVSERYLTYLLMAQVEAGLLSLEFDVVDPPTNTDVSVTLHPPAQGDYRRLYTPSDDPPAPLEVANSFRTRLVPGEDSGFVDVAFTPDGSHVLTRSVDSRVRRWDLLERTQDDAFAFEVNPAIGSAFDAACTQIATASADHSVRVWDLATQTVVAMLEAHTHVAECVAFSPDGLRLVSGSFDQTAIVWDLATQTPLHVLSGHTGRVTSVAFDAAGTRVVSGGEDGTVRLWDAATGAPMQVMTGHGGPVNCAVFSPDGLRIASASDDRTLRLWQAATGTPLRTLTGHTDRVLWVDFGVGGTRLLSGSADNTLRHWSIFGSSPLATLGEHRSDVTRVRFERAVGSSRNVSVSAGGAIRIWEDIFAGTTTTELRRDFMRVEVFATIVDHNAPPGTPPFEGPLAVFVYLALDADKAANGLEVNHRLRLSFGRLDPGTKVLLAAKDVDVPLVESTLREQLDRDLPLGVAQGQQVQQLRMRKHFDESTGKRTLGIYVDLGLRSAPREFREPRGILALARDFRGIDQEIAFATSKKLFSLLGPDARFQRAEPVPGTDRFRFPLRKDPNDSSNDEIGTIDGVSVGPEIVPSGGPGSSPHITGRLRIKVDATYTDSTPDLGFAVNFLFRPKRDARGVVDWKADVDVDVGLLATLLIVVAGLVVLLPFLGGVGIAFWLLVGTLASLVGGRGLAEYYASKKLAEEGDLEKQASVLDALPFRLPAATRRWDPFYETQHQIVAELDEDMIIDRDGIAFSAREVVLDKEPVLRDDIAPHSEERDAQGVSAIVYEVPDFVRFEEGFSAKGPGVDRMDFLRPDPAGRPTLVQLTIDQILERKAADRILAPIVLDARRIYLHGGQIDQLLCCTWRVRTQQRNRLIGEFQSRRRAEIRAEVEQELVELGTPATAEEIEALTEERFQETIAEDQKEYEGGALRMDLHVALAPLLRFDLAPEEMVALQEKGVFVIDGKEIIVRHNRNGTVTPYYRDHPDGDPRDNLLTLPPYAFPYQPPPA